MKIKHFAGYGSVDAKKVVTTAEYVDVMVEGNHEQGLTRPFDDVYCIDNWLGRFLPKAGGDVKRTVKRYAVLSNNYHKVGNLDTEFALYRLYY